MTFSTIEPGRAGVASEIRYSPITHGYHLFSPSGEMLGNPYGYESYLQAERADSGRCLTCGNPSPVPICADCVTTAHRCSEGHALGDDGGCGVCQDIEDTDQARLRDAEADEAEPWKVCTHTTDGKYWVACAAPGDGPCLCAAPVRPSPAQSGLCWCYTWRLQGGLGDCPDCRSWKI